MIVHSVYSIAVRLLAVACWRCEFNSHVGRFFIECSYLSLIPGKPCARFLNNLNCVDFFVMMIVLSLICFCFDFAVAR